MAPIANVYVICPTPAEDDPVWATALGGWDESLRSLDGSQVVLKWETGLCPSTEEIERLGGTRYSHAGIVEIISGAEWSP